MTPVEIATERHAVQDLEFAGRRAARRDLVLAVLGSANRDERRFAMPDQLDITRAPNPYLSFGQGVHYCLGAPLARLEDQIDALVRRVPHLRLGVSRQTHSGGGTACSCAG